MAGIEDSIDELYGLPLEQFTKARNELAKRLRGEGEREVAAEVAKLPKPSRPAWAINRVARANPKLVEALTDAAADLAAAQETAVSGSGREALDEAVAAERAAVDALVAETRIELEVAGSGSPVMVDRARKTLHAVAGDPELCAELEARRVVTDREPIGFGAIAPVPARRGQRRSGSTGSRGSKKTKTPSSAESAEEQATRAQLADARRRASRAQRRVETGERNVAHAAERLASAQARLSAAEAELAEQKAELEQRREELKDANAVLAELS